MLLPAHAPVNRAQPAAGRAVGRSPNGCAPPAPPG